MRKPSKATIAKWNAQHQLDAQKERRQRRAIGEHAGIIRDLLAKHGYAKRTPSQVDHLAGTFYAMVKTVAGSLLEIDIRKVN
jgi:hypothetical protein